MESGQNRPVQRAGVAMPRHCGNIPARPRKDGGRVGGLVGVVVVCPDFGIQSGVAQSWTDVVLDEITGFVGVDVHGRHLRARVERFVLDGDGVDFGALGLVRLEVFDEVLGELGGVGVVEVVVYRGTLNHAVELHPTWWTPGRAEDGEAGLETSHLGEQRGHGVAAVAEVEVGKGEIGLAVGVVVRIGWVGREVGGGNGVSHHGKVGAGGGHEGVEQGGALGGGEGVEHGHGGVGDGGAEAFDGLLPARGSVVYGELPC